MPVRAPCRRSTSHSMAAALFHTPPCVQTESRGASSNLLTDAFIMIILKLFNLIISSAKLSCDTVGLPILAMGGGKYKWASKGFLHTTKVTIKVKG